MKPKKVFEYITAVLILIAISYLFYNFFIKQEDQIITTSAALKKIDREFFNNEDFKKLKATPGLPVKIGNIGKDDPFFPLSY